VIELLEIAYLCCYPMVPAGIACLYFAGLGEESDRFWTAVRPGGVRLLRRIALAPDAAAARDRRRASAIARLVKRVNLRVLGVASVQLNTFPSGHAAASLATALAVGARLPLAGLALGLLALAIAIGSVVGRYHYAADALAGAALAILGFVISRSV
jgi:membrane-associated phospholipid phosphatase